MGLSGFERQRARRVAAVLACALWLIGVEVLPGVHVALHASLAPHVHDAGPAAGPVITVHVDDGWHTHGPAGHVHRWAAPIDDPDPAATGVHGPGRSPADHAGHSLAHRTLAIASPPVVITRPIPVPRAIIAVAHPVARLSAATRPPHASARAPPSPSIAT